MTKKLTVLTVGEAMVELSASTDPSLWHLGFAGDTFNTAWYLRQLLPDAEAVGFLTRLGQGGFSQRLRGFIADAGIVTDHVSTDPLREVGLYAIELKDGERSFSYWRGQSAARGLADDPAALERAFAEVEIVYLSGITAAILPPQGRDNLAVALARAKGGVARVVFDPNIRPRLWEDADTLRAQITRFAAMADLVLPSFDDEAAHFGDPSPQDTIARYRAAGTAQVVVKNGGGAVWFGGASEGCVDDLPKAQPVDSTAAGDSFNAGYLAATIQGAAPEDAIRNGHTAAMKVIAARGALVRL